MSNAIQNLRLSDDEREQRTILQDVLTGLFAGEIPVTALFSPDYQQFSDGVQLDLAGFTEHLHHLHNHVSEVAFEVLDACVCDDRLAERHIATVTHKNGDVSQLEVYVFMRLEDQYIRSLYEVSQVISGAEKDKELASATR